MKNIRIFDNIYYTITFLIIRFEKYISGKYLGEIVRVVLAKLYKDGLLFIGDHTPGSLLVPGNLTSDLVSDIEQYVFSN